MTGWRHPGRKNKALSWGRISGVLFLVFVPCASGIAISANIQDSLAPSNRLRPWLVGGGGAFGFIAPLAVFAYRQKLADLAAAAGSFVAPYAWMLFCPIGLSFGGLLSVVGVSLVSSGIGKGPGEFIFMLLCGGIVFATGVTFIVVSAFRPLVSAATIIDRRRGVREEAGTGNQSSSPGAAAGSQSEMDEAESVQAGTPTLDIIVGDAARSIALRNGMTIGRAAGNDICLADDYLVPAEMGTFKISAAGVTLLQDSEANAPEVNRGSFAVVLEEDVPHWIGTATVSSKPAGQNPAVFQSPNATRSIASRIEAGYAWAWSSLEAGVELMQPAAKPMAGCLGWIGSLIALLIGGAVMGYQKHARRAARYAPTPPAVRSPADFDYDLRTPGNRLRLPRERDQSRDREPYEWPTPSPPKVTSSRSFDQPPQVNGDRRSLFNTQTLTVAPDGTGDHRTISAAVAAAPAGARILVQPGTYGETVALTRPVVIEASSSAPTIIQSATGTPLTIQADATVKGLTIRRAGSGSVPAVVAIYSSPTLANCTIRSEGGTGLEVASGGNVTLSGCTIGECGGSGVLVRYGGTCEGRFCNIDRNGDAGMKVVGDGSEATLSSSTLTGNGVGAWAEQNATIRLTGCNLRGNRTPTIQTDGGRVEWSRTETDR